MTSSPPPISSNKGQASQDVLIAVQAEGARQILRKEAAAAEKQRQIAQAIASMPRQEIIPEPGTALYDNMIQQRMEQRRQMMRKAGVSEWYIWGEFFLPGGSFDQMMETLAPLAAAVETRTNIQATVEGNRPLPPVAAEVRPVAGGAAVAGPMGGRGGLRLLSPGSVPLTGEAFLAIMASAAATPEQARKIAELIDLTQSLMAGARARLPEAAAAEAQMNLGPQSEQLHGVGPAPGVIEVSPRVKSTKVFLDNISKVRGKREFVFIPKTNTFLLALFSAPCCLMLG